MEKIIDEEIHTVETIIVKHARLVHWQCHKFKKYAAVLGQEYDDIASIGMYALVEAFEHFDCKQNETKFSSYATYIVRGRILHHLSKCNPGLYYPRYIKELAQKIRKYELEDSPIDEIVEKTGTHQENVDFALGYLRNRNPNNINQLLSGETSVYLADSLCTSDDATEIYVQEFLFSLNERERIVVNGLMAGMSQCDLGAALGVTGQRVWNMKRTIAKKYQEFVVV